MNVLVGGLAFSFRVWELFVLTIVLQVGMLPLMARDKAIVLTRSLAARSRDAPITAIRGPAPSSTIAIAASPKPSR